MGEFAPGLGRHPAGERLKKADIASEAGAMVDGTGWMPAIFAADPQENARRTVTDEDAPEERRRRGG